MKVRWRRDPSLFRSGESGADIIAFFRNVGVGKGLPAFDFDSDTLPVRPFSRESLFKLEIVAIAADDGIFTSKLPKAFLCR